MEKIKKRKHSVFNVLIHIWKTETMIEEIVVKQERARAEFNMNENISKNSMKSNFFECYKKSNQITSFIYLFKHDL